jgi:hypothetical protein
MIKTQHFTKNMETKIYVTEEEDNVETNAKKKIYVAKDTCHF